MNLKTINENWLRAFSLHSGSDRTDGFLARAKKKLAEFDATPEMFQPFEDFQDGLKRDPSYNERSVHDWIFGLEVVADDHPEFAAVDHEVCLLGRAAATILNRSGALQQSQERGQEQLPAPEISLPVQTLQALTDSGSEEVDGPAEVALSPQAGEVPAPVDVSPANDAPAPPPLDETEDLNPEHTA